MLGRLALASLLIACGWAAGRAQSSVPDFELVVDAPAGSVKVECVRGCRLSWVERGVNPRAAQVPVFEFTCTSGERCGSGRIGGWMAR